jgi:(2R)-3-sulfolactate dehydrogenase (NADP+)
MPIRSIDQIFALTKNALIAHGAADWQADEVAKATAHSESYGNVICGLQYVESYCIQLATGRVDGRADPKISTPRASAILSDARMGFAQPAFAKGLEQACKVARDAGIALLLC